MDDVDLILSAVAELTAEVRALRADLAGRSMAGPDPRHTELLEALGVVVIDGDLSFECSEVLRHAGVDDRLSRALEACRATDTESLGLVFRCLKGKTVNGLRLNRDGRQWRLVRV